MNSSWTRNLTFLLAFVLLASVPAFAQGTVGAISGTVADPTGAVVPGATVTLVNEATGVTREVSTNEAGQFVFDRVRPGVYKLRITMSGFRTHEVPALEVSVGKVSALGEVKLEVGRPEEVVTVEAGATPLVQGDSPEIVGRYDARVVSDINWGTFGLDATSFLTAGILPSFGNINTNTGGFGAQIGGDAGAVPAAAGLRGRQTQFAVDGHEINDISIGGPAFFIQNQDTVSEYQVSVNQFDASSGRLPGAQVNIITKSGTNDLHGSLFYFYESNALRGRTSSESRNDDEKPKLIQQTYGFTGGGPIIKNRWFAFGSYQRFKIPGNVLDSTGGTGTVALTNAGAATLAAAFPASGAVQAYAASGPFTRPDGSPSCASAPLLVSISGVMTEACEIERAIPQDESFFEYTLRMDVSLNKQSFSGKWFHQKDAFCCSGGTDGYWIAIPSGGESLSFSHTYQFTPRVLNDFRFSYGRFFVTFAGANTEGLGNIRGNLANFSFTSGLLDDPTSADPNDTLSLLGFGLATNLPQGRLLYNFQWQDNISIVRGRHTIKAGLEYRRNRTTAPFLPFVNGAFSYGSQGEFTGDTGLATFTEGPISFQPFETDQFYYVQDDIRLRPNFTLNLGLRYEHTGQPVNNIHDFQLARETGPGAFWLQTVPLEQRVFPKIDADNNNWGPRIGFAYTPRFWKGLFGEDKTVIRGGYSIGYETAFYNILLNINTSAPQVFSFSLPNFPVPGGGTGNEVAAAIPTPRNTFDPRQFFTTGVSNPLKSPYVQNWSLGFQRELGSNQVVEARYTGNKMVGGYQSVNGNPDFNNLFTFFPEFVPAGFTPCVANEFQGPVVQSAVGRVRCDQGPLRVRQNGGRSIYHGLQARYEYRNLANQLTGGVNFQWGKSIDNVSEIFNFTEGGSRAFSENPFDWVGAERGLSNHHIGRALTAFWIWDAPWHRDQQGAVGKILGGWEWTGQLFLYDGRPWTAVQSSASTSASAQGFCSEDFNFNTSFVGARNTCRLFLADPSAPMETVGNFGAPGVHWWRNNNLACSIVSCPAGTPFGAGRNIAFGDGVVLTNMSFIKNTRFGPEGRFNFSFRANVVNIFNHRNFGPPASLFSDSPSFGRPNRNDVAGRIVRLSLRLSF